MAELSINTLLYLLLGALVLIIVATLFIHWKNGSLELAQYVFESASSVTMP